jgi:uncharacterized protein
VTEPGRSHPVGETERFESLDVLRGFALLGILVVNIQHFAMFAGTVRNPTFYGDLQGANFWVFALTYTLALQKFLPIFSMLFGAGIVLMADRLEALGDSPASLHYRRMTALLAIALVHAYLVWYGDILVPYAICGSLVFLFRRRSPATLIGLGIACLAISPLLRLALYLVPSMLGSDPGQPAPSMGPVIERDLAAFRGEWADQFGLRVRYALQGHTFGFFLFELWRLSGLMLIGMALYKVGVLTARRSARFYAGLAVAGFGVALPVTALALFVNVRAGWTGIFARVLGGQSIYWLGTVMGLGWIGLVMLGCRNGCSSPFVRPLAAAGRMALTNYLLQSVVCTFVFYGWGLGLYGHVERVGQAAMVVGVWALLLTLSPLWLRYFRFGPAEWLWRSLSYGRVQPFLRRPASKIPAL